MTAELAEYVLDQVGADRVRRMFGGWGIYRDGEMVAIVYDGRTYIKATTKAVQEKFIAAGMHPFSPRPQQTLRSFWEVPSDVLDDTHKLEEWMNAGESACNPSP